jgi:hypothetical protein
MFAVEKNIPIPKRGADKKGELRLTLENMEVGDSIVVPNSLRNAAHSAAKKAKIKVAMRTINSETRDARVWRK